MKKYLGIFLILLSIILTHIFWILLLSGSGTPSTKDYSQLIASLALVLFAWVNYISSRHRLIDGIFNGLDKSYIYHKHLSILAIIFVWVHNFTLKIDSFSAGGPSLENFSQIQGTPGSFSPENLGGNSLYTHLPGKQFGSLSMYIFTAFILFFIIAYKLEYQRWKLLHTLMLVPYALGIVHYYTTSEYNVFSITPYSFWMNIVNIVGILSALYAVFLYESFGFKYKYKVTSIKEVAKETIEITGTAVGRGMEYKPGQFAFMKVPGRNKGFPSHPFTMSQTNRPNEIQFAVKILGDHTSNLFKNLTLGDTIVVSGPFGRFDYRAGSKHQIWLAGGIGITPFRSFWQTEINNDYSIDLFYAYNNEKEGAYIHELNAMNSRSNLKIHLFDSAKTGFLTSQDFEKRLSKDVQYDVYFCGPKAMRLAAERDLKKADFKIREYHYENFQFK